MTSSCKFIPIIKSSTSSDCTIIMCLEIMFFVDKLHFFVRISTAIWIVNGKQNNHHIFLFTNNYFL